MRVDEVRGFAEICWWLAEGRPIQEVMHRLSAVDLDLLEWFGHCAQEKEVVAVCGMLPAASLEVVNEYCALSRVRRHARVVCSCE